MGDECKALAAELLKQPELLAGVFLDSAPAIPESETLVAAAKQYTGARSTTDDNRLLMVGALRLLGASDREIESACGVTRRTIPVLLAELERTGRVTPLKDRLIRVVGDNAERSGLLLRKLMERGMDGTCDMDLAAMLKAVGQVNDFQIEKFQLLTGQATERVEQVVGAGREDFERWWRESATPITAQVDIASTDSPRNAEEIGGNGSTDTCTIPTPPTNADETRPAGGGASESGPAGKPMV